MLRHCQQSVTTKDKGLTSSALPDDGNYGLGKRLTHLQDDSQSFVPQSLSYRAEFTKEFLASARAQQTGVNILKVGLGDYYSEVTVVETNALFQLFLLGTTKGKIKCVFLSKNEDQNRIDSEVIREERLKREKEVADINAAANNIDPIVNEEFFFNLSVIDFVGHCSVITAISLKYNNARFVSAAVDGEVRLWDIGLHACLAVYRDHFEGVFALKMSPKDDFFVSSGSERLLYLWKEGSGS